MKHPVFFSILLLLPFALLSCAGSSDSSGNFVSRSGSGTIISQTPTTAQRKVNIANEATGAHFIARRYFVKRTAYWYYIRKPRQSWNDSKLSVVNDWKVRGPDRLAEAGPLGARLGYNQNYEYKLWGRFSGEKVYDPNFNSYLPEFILDRYELISKKPGWIFTPKDRYNPEKVTLRGF